MKFSTPLSQIRHGATAQGKSIETVIEYLSALGVEAIDLSADSLEVYNLSADDIKGYCKKYNITIASIYDLMDFKHKSPDILKIMKERAKVRLERCAEFGCPIYMPVPVIEEEHENKQSRDYALKTVTQFLYDAAEISEQYGVITTVENYSNVNTPFSYISDISYILDNIPKVKYVFDSGNYWFGCSDMLAACKKFADRTAYVHLKDIKENPDGALDISGRCGDSVAIGEGELPIYDAVNVLKSAGYEGLYQIEINNYTDNMISDIETSIMNLKANIKK